MRIQTFIRARGPDFRVFQVTFYRAAPDAPPDYLVTKLSGRLPSGTVSEFFRSGEWFHDLMSFANREKEVRDGTALTLNEAKMQLARWRQRTSAAGFGDEREYMDGIRVKRKTVPGPQS